MFRVELEFHPYLLTQLQPVFDIHAKHGIVAEAYGPLSPLLRHPGGPLKPILAKLAKKYDTDEASILLRWTIQYGVVAVTSSKNEERIKGYYKLWEFELTPEEVKEIEETGRTIHFRAYDVSVCTSVSISVGKEILVQREGRKGPVADGAQEHMVDNFPVPNSPDGGEDGKPVPKRK